MHRAPLRRLAPAAATLLGLAAFAGPAHGAPVAGPGGEITYNTGSVVLSGFPNGATLVTVTRNGATIGTGTANVGGTAAAPGVANAASLNVMGIAAPEVLDCWTGTTPDILPGDVVTIGGAAGTSVTVPDFSISAPSAAGSDIVAHGKAADAATGAPVAADVFLNSKALGGIAKFTGAAKQKGGALMGGAFSFDAPGSSAFTARFAGLSASDFALGLSGTVAAEVSTIPPAVHPAAGAAVMTVAADNPGNPGPVPGCSAPLASYAVTGASTKTINSANVNQALTISGTAAPDAKSASILVGGTTVPAVLAGGAWTATVPAASLPEGTLNVVGQYTNATGGPFGGRTMTITKDTLAPSAPTVNVPAGTYSDTKLVSLQSAEGTIHYTLDGSDATANSKTYRGPINVADTATIKAVAVDAAGNVSDMASYAYTISRPQPVAPPVFVAPVAAPKLKLDALTLGSSYKLKTVRKRGFSMVVFAPEGAKFVRARLLLNGRLITRVIRKVSSDGVMTITLPSTKTGRRHLKRGTYKVQVAPGQTASQFGATTTRTVRIR